MPLAVTPAGVLSRHYAALIYLLAACANFRSVVGAATADAALAFIHFPHAPDSAPARPRAIVQPGNDFVMASLGTGTWRTTGNAWLSFEFPAVNDPGDPPKDILEFTNRVGPILAEMWDTKIATQPDGLQTYIQITKIELVEGPSSCIPEEENGELFYGATFAISWV